MDYIAMCVYIYIYIYIYAQTLIVVALIVVNLFNCCLTLLETVPFVVDHPWKQDSLIFPLTVGGKTGPDIDQGGSKLKLF